VYLYSKGAIKVQASLFPGLDGGYNMTVTFPEGLASGQQGGQPRPQAQPRPRGAQAENWRRRDPAADPGPKKKPRRRKANVQSSTQCPPAAEPVALAPGHQEGGSNSGLKRRSRSATRTARQHLKMAEEAAETQVASAPEAPAPTAVEELGAGSHAPPPAPAATATTPASPSCPRLVEATLVEKQEAKDVAALAAAARAGPPAGLTLVVAPAKTQEVGAPKGITPEGAIWVAAALASAARETKRREAAAAARAIKAPLAARALATRTRTREAAAAARATKTQEAAAPATPPRAMLATACPPSSGKRGASRSCSSASPGSSGGRLSPPIDAGGFQLVVGRMGKGRSGSGAKIPKMARERERDGSLC